MIIFYNQNDYSLIFLITFASVSLKLFKKTENEKNNCMGTQEEIMVSDSKERSLICFIDAIYILLLYRKIGYKECGFDENDSLEFDNILESFYRCLRPMRFDNDKFSEILITVELIERIDISDFIFDSAKQGDYITTVSKVKNRLALEKLADAIERENEKHKNEVRFPNAFKQEYIPLKERVNGVLKSVKILFRI